MDTKAEISYDSKIKNLVALIKSNRIFLAVPTKVAATTTSTTTTATTTAATTTTTPATTITTSTTIAIIATIYLECNLVITITTIIFWHKIIINKFHNSLNL